MEVTRLSIPEMRAVFVTARWMFVREWVAGPRSLPGRVTASAPEKPSATADRCRGILPRQGVRQPHSAPTARQIVLMNAFRGQQLLAQAAVDDSRHHRRPVVLSLRVAPVICPLLKSTLPSRAIDGNGRSFAERVEAWSRRTGAGVFPGATMYERSGGRSRPPRETSSRAFSVALCRRRPRLDGASWRTG